MDGWALAIRLRHRLRARDHAGRRAARLARLLVRPRYHRLEIGTEFLDTRADLVVATLLVLAGMIAAWHAIGQPSITG